MLTDIQIRKAKAAINGKVYRLADGKGLCLEVKPNGARLWRFRYRTNGKANMLSLGSYPEIGLSDARERLAEARKQVANNIDPSQVRKAEKASRLNTFGEACREWHGLHAKELDPANAKAMYRRLELNILPWLEDRPIADIKPNEVLLALRRVEARGTVETAHRLLGWCSQIFRYAVASGQIATDPTRDLRGALAKPKEKHYAAFTDPKDIKGLLLAVDAYHGALVTRTALMFGILTFVRPGNLRKAEWSEFYGLDTENPEWRIAGEKMKRRTDRPFITPLAPQAIQMLEEIRPLTGRGQYVFPCPRTTYRPMSNNAVNAALRRMGFTKDEITGHGFRAMARTVCHEVLHYEPEVLEEQLAHGKMGALRDAYDRTTHMPERRRLMTEWANWLDELKSKPEKA